MFSLLVSLGERLPLDVAALDAEGRSSSIMPYWLLHARRIPVFRNL